MRIKIKIRFCLIIYKVNISQLYRANFIQIGLFVWGQWPFKVFNPLDKITKVVIRSAAPFDPKSLRR